MVSELLEGRKEVGGWSVGEVIGGEKELDELGLRTEGKGVMERGRKFW